MVKQILIIAVDVEYHFHFVVGPPVVSPLLYQSYEEQQYAELTTLFQLIVTKDMPILLGDFNHGPASPGNITWELPFHYGLMNARGFYSPYVLVDGRCTFCSTNPTAFFPLDLIIDHIYLPTSTRRRVISSKVRPNFEVNYMWSCGYDCMHHEVKYLFHDVR